MPRQVGHGTVMPPPHSALLVLLYNPLSLYTHTWREGGRGGEGKVKMTWNKEKHKRKWKERNALTENEKGDIDRERGASETRGQEEETRLRMK